MTLSVYIIIRSRAGNGAQSMKREKTKPAFPFGDGQQGPSSF